MKKISPKLILALQLVVMLYTLSSVAAKMASGQAFLSLPFIVYYGVEILILGFYAIAWQQIIKRCDLSVAYANRSMAILWSLVWTVIFFHESLTVKNIIVPRLTFLLQLQISSVSSPVCFDALKNQVALLPFSAPHRTVSLLLPAHGIPDPSHSGPSRHPG